MQQLTLGFSPCPNDTFIFHALVHGLVACPGFGFRERLADVETLNRLALEGALDVSKVSSHLLGFIREDYCLLRSGGALGRGCGPLVVSAKHAAMEELRGKRIAVPGRFTTAHLLLR
ncbi:MAG TPA: MqnA/MqnD/SBP family protein, partial [Geobacteraceae bacterium]|nr:MqnA/MqnD/SBP family protein [Geobacteraceae bacterium]